jgi:plastocyanin
VTPPVVTPPPVITPPVTTTPKTVTADLTAGVENDITVNVGDTVHYVWNTTLPYPSILTTPDITTVCRTGVGKWFGYAGDANMKGTPSSGSEDMLVQSCDAGHTYNISYSVTNTYPAAPISTRYGSFNTSVRIHVNDAQGNLGSPTSSLTVNGQKEVTVNVGDTLSYAWTSTGAVSASNVVNAPSCAKFYNTPLPSGYADSLQGSKAFVVPSCEAGNEFYVTYTVTDANGRSSSSMVGVHVRMLPFSVLGSQAINGVFNTGPNALNIMANVDKASYKRGDYITVVWSNPIVKQDVYNPAPGQGINLFKVNMYVLNVATGQKILIGHNQHLSGVSVLQVGSDTQLSGTAPFNALGYNLPNIGNPFPTTGSYVIVADLVTNIQAHGAGEIFTPITSGQTQPFTISSLASNQSSINVANALSALQSMLESIRHFLGN